MQRKKDDCDKLGVIADGPFRVTKVLKNAVRLAFPANSKAHPVVNVSRVQYYFGPKPEEVTAPPTSATEPLYAVDKILAREIRKGKPYYYIHWKNYPADDDSWEPEDNLTPDLVAEYNT